MTWEEVDPEHALDAEKDDSKAEHRRDEQTKKEQVADHDPNRMELAFGREPARPTSFASDQDRDVKLHEAERHARAEINQVRGRLRLYCTGDGIDLVPRDCRQRLDWDPPEEPLRRGIFSQSYRWVKTCLRSVHVFLAPLPFQLLVSAGEQEDRAQLSTTDD
jgi:hypothetical protein